MTIFFEFWPEKVKKYDAFFFAHENSLFAHKMHSLPRPPHSLPRPPFFAQTPSLFAHKFSPRAFFTPKRFICKLLGLKYVLIGNNGNNG